MARLLALVCVLAACSAASARLLLQGPAYPVDTGSTIPVEASPVPLAGAVLASPGPILAALPLNDTAVVPAILVPVANTSDATTGAADAGNETAPTFATFADALAAANSTTANLTMLVALIDAAGLATAINDTTAWTILAPTNAAFEAQAALANATTDEFLNLTLSDIPTLTALLSFHVIPSGAFLSTNLTDGMNVSTALPSANLTVNVIGSNVTFTSVGGLVPLTEDATRMQRARSNATVIVPDILAGASVIHVIDTLLMPPVDLLPNATVPGAEAVDTDIDLIGTAAPTPPLPTGAPAGEVGLAPVAESPAGQVGLAPIGEAPAGELGLAPVGELAPAGEVGLALVPAGELVGAPAGEAPAGETMLGRLADAVTGALAPPAEPAP